MISLKGDGGKPPALDDYVAGLLGLNGQNKYRHVVSPPRPRGLRFVNYSVNEEGVERWWLGLDSNQSSRLERGGFAD